MKYKMKMQFTASMFYKVQVDDQYFSKYVLFCNQFIHIGIYLLLTVFMKILIFLGKSILFTGNFQTWKIFHV